MRWYWYYYYLFFCCSSCFGRVCVLGYDYDWSYDEVEEEEYDPMYFAPDNMYGSPYGGYARATRSRLASLPLRLTTSTSTDYYTIRDGLGRLLACHVYPEHELTPTSIGQSMMAPAIERKEMPSSTATTTTTDDDTATDTNASESSSNHDPKEDEAAVVEVEESKVVVKEEEGVNVKEAIQKLKGACSQIHDGWWSYEWCHEESITQFHIHLEGNRHTVQSMTNLGIFEHLKVISDDPENVMAQASYARGDWCEEAKTYRSTIVDYTCCPSVPQKMDTSRYDRTPSDHQDDFAILQQLQEPETCHYHLHVCTNVLCTSTQQQQQQQPPKIPSISKDSSIREILKLTLNSHDCLYKSIGWWKYEFCYGKHVRQYHEMTTIDERTGMMTVLKESDQQHFLGYYDMLVLETFEDADEEFFLVGPQHQLPQKEPKQPFNQEQLSLLEKVHNMMETSFSSNHPMAEEDNNIGANIFIQEYLHGEVCEHPDVTESFRVGGGSTTGSSNFERSTTIRYSCGPTKELIRVQEDISCHYVFDITVPELCQHPNFQAPHIQTNVVKCIPITPQQEQLL